MSTEHLSHVPGDGGVVGDESPGVDPLLERRSTKLKLVLMSLDLLALVIAWGFGFWVTRYLGWQPVISAVKALSVSALGVLSGMALIASKRLWLSRVCALRSVELTLLGQVAVLSCLSVLGAAALVKERIAMDRLVVTLVLSFTLLAQFRGLYRAWLERARKRGSFARRMIIVGANREAAELVTLLGKHRAAGVSFCGLVGPSDRSKWLEVPWLGGYDKAVAAMRFTGATGALVVGSAMTTDELNRVIREILRAGGHVHLSSGLRGISHGRLRKMPLAYEPLLYVERTDLSRAQLYAKRALDLTFSFLLLVPALPVMLFAIAAIKLQGDGPLIFRQQRVGQEGKLFEVLKLRTMEVGAEGRLQELLEHNERNGPLFKLGRDPRVTRVGRILRATSIDELPQLFNVLRGDMSLVGPRPVLPEEAEQFDEELRTRQRMLPGITGLWQVEARDDPDFSSYRRFDLFYVENWSVGLDLSILLATATAVFRHTVTNLTGRRVTVIDVTEEASTGQLPDAS